MAFWPSPLFLKSYTGIGSLIKFVQTGFFEEFHLQAASALYHAAYHCSHGYPGLYDH